MNIKTAENLVSLLTNLVSVSQLKLDISGTKVDQKMAIHLCKALSHVEGVTS